MCLNKLTTMKNIILLILLIAFTACKAQSIILPLGTKGDRKAGAYYKDLDNDLLPYIGTWSGTVSNKSFRITFQKVKEYEDFDNSWTDRLYGRYEINDLNGNLIASTYSLIDDDVDVTSLGFFYNKTKLKFYYNGDCYEGHIYLNFTDSTKTKIQWEYVSIPTIITNNMNCPESNEIPQERFILTKQ